MTIKEIIYDAVLPATVTGAVASANLVRNTLLKINAQSYNYDSAVDEIIHTGTGISVMLGCIYMIIKIYVTAKHKN